MSLIDPRFTKDFVEWAQFMFPTLEQYGPIEIVDSKVDWQNWASGLLSIGSIAEKAPPNPNQFSDWKDWATRFNESLGQGY